MGSAIQDSLEHLALKALRLARTLHLERLIHFGRRTCPLTDYFKGLENVEAVRRIFGDRTEEILRRTRVEFTPFIGYMGVDSSDGHIVISSRYINEGDRVDIYLDLIHELVHVRQLTEGKELFDSRFSYAERPTEVEAYRHAVEEARRLGLTDERICDYLKTEWMSDEDLKLLARALNIECGR